MSVVFRPCVSHYLVSQVYQWKSRSKERVLLNMPKAVIFHSLLDLLYPIMLIALIFHLLCNL